MAVMRQTIFLILLFLCGLSCLAQDADSVLTEEEVSTFETSVKHKLDDFLSYLSQIGSKQVGDMRKDAAVKGALDLFIGKGYKYYYEDEWGNKKEHAPVTMQTTNKYGRTYPPKPMTIYLNNMRKLRYTEVRIERANALRISEITQINDSCYRAVAYYIEKFFGKTADGQTYLDFGQKKLFVFLEKQDVDTLIPTPDGTVIKREFVKLGDISAVESH